MSSARAKLRHPFWLVVVLLLGAHASRGPIGMPPELVDGTLGSLSTVALELLAAAVCVRGALSHPAERLPRLILAGGITMFAAGDLVFLVALGGTFESFPTLSDFLWGGLYASALVFLVIQGRRALSPIRPAVVLDGAVVALTFAAVLAQVFYDHGFRDAVADRTVVTGQLAYPVMDLLCLGAFVALWLAIGWRRLGGFRLAGLGLALLLAADSASVLAVSGDNYQAGASLDTLWPVSFLLIAGASVLPAQMTSHVRRGWRASVVPAVGLVACLIMLALASSEHERLWAVASIAAVLAVVLSVARLVLTLVENERLLEERREALGRATESEEGYRRILETTDDGVWIVDEHNFTTFVNTRMAQMLGTTQQALLGESILDSVAPDGDGIARVDLAAHQGSAGAHREVALRRPDGSLVWTLMSTSPIHGSDGAFSGAVTMVTDISARKRAEQEIRFQAGLLDQVHAALVAVDSDGRVVYWSRGAEELYGWSSTEARGKIARDLIAPGTDLEESTGGGQGAHEEGAYEIETELVRRDGSRFAAYTRNSVIRGPDGAVLGSVGMSLDVTERKLAETESRLLASIVASANVAMVSTDRDGLITSWNRGAEELYGWSADEAIGQNVDLITVEVGADGEHAARRRAILEGEALDAIEGCRRTRDGRKIDVSLNVSAIRDGDGNVVGVSSMAYNITERKRAERNAAAQHAVASVLAVCQTVGEALPRLLDALGTVLGFDAARASVSAFEEEPRRASWTRPGATDVAELSHPVARVPVMSDDDRVGEIEFFASGVVTVDDDLENTLEALGSQIGQFVRRRQAERALRESSERHRAILDNTPALIYVKDSDLRYTIANREFERTHGFEPGGALGKRDEDMVPADIVAILKERDREVLDHGRIVQGETKLELGGETRTFVSVKFPLRDADGMPFAIGAVATDITESRRAIEERQRVEERLANAQRVAHIGSWDWDIGSDRFTWSDELYRIYGHQPGAFEADLSRCLEFIHPSDRDMVRDKLDRALSGQPVRYTHRALRADGSERYVEAHAEAIFGDDGTAYAMRGTAQDITERRETELALAASRSSLAEAQQLAQVGSFVRDLVTGNATWSDELYRIFARPLGSPPPSASELVELFHPDDRGDITEVLTTPGTDAPFDREYRIVRPDGELRVLSCRVRIASDKSGQPLKISGVAQDITERQVAEERLRASEESYRRIVETANEGVWLIDADGETTFTNARMAEMLGRSADEMLGRNVLDFMAPGWRDAALDHIGARREGVEDFRLVRADGSEFWALVSSSPLFDERGSYVGTLGMVADITDRMHAQEKNQRLEEELHQSQKLESVGQLAGGIAHDFNNLLAVILNYAEFASEDVGDPKQLNEDITSIREAAERATDLTRQLLIFSRREPVAPRVINLNNVVGQTERLLKRTLGEHIELACELCRADPSVHADSGQIEQVLMNLAVNARDAIGDAGTITIETAEEEIEPDAVTGLEPGLYARVSVRDDGCGMSEGVASRALEPFFSTKPRGSGTGLGLATVYGIVKQAGGTVVIRSEQDTGTTVDVYLPAVLVPGTVPDDEPAKPTALDGSGERVLVVEDEDAVREVTVRTLARHGYDVLEASGPDGATAVWEEHEGEIDLVLTDVVMPGSSGKTLIEELRKRSPDIRFVYMSGYTDDVLVRHGTGATHTTLLEKPFSRDTLLRTVRDAIAGKVPA